MMVKQNLKSVFYQGFTLIELVIVIIVMAVLAAVALPKLTSKSAFEDYAIQDQLISRLRLVQLQDMNADPAVDASDNACYWVVVKSACFYNEETLKNAQNICLPPSANVSCSDTSYSQYNVVNFSEGMLTPANYHFDIQGRLTTNEPPARISININGDNGLSIKIESEGYIHE